MKRAALVGNGPLNGAEIGQYDTIIAVDGGLNHLDGLNIIPSMIVGDLDSLDPALLLKYKDIPIKQYPVEKDFSDMELALLEVMDHDKVTLFGAFGKRVDHSLYNIALLRRHPNKLTLDTGIDKAFVITKNSTIPTHKGQTISLLPLSDSVTGLNTKGLKWNLEESTLNINSLSLSNIALSTEVTIHLEQGQLLICLS